MGLSLCLYMLSCVQLFRDPTGCSPTRLLCLWDSPDRNTGVGCHFLLQQGICSPRDGTRSPTLQAHSLPSEPPGTPSFTGSVTLVLLKPGLPLQEWFLRMGAGTSTLARVGPERTREEVQLRLCNRWFISGRVLRG